MLWTMLQTSLAHLGFWDFSMQYFKFDIQYSAIGIPRIILFIRQQSIEEMLMKNYIKKIKWKNHRTQISAHIVHIIQIQI